MDRQVQARSGCDSVGSRRWLCWLKPAVLLGSLGMMIALHGGAVAQVTGGSAPGGQPTPPGQGGGTPTNQNLKLTKLAPKSVLVRMNNGVGQATVVYARKVGEAAPVLDWTDAVGATNSIAKDKIKVQWVGQPQTVGKNETLTLGISVETREWVEPTATYEGQIIFIWPDGNPQPETFTITNAVVADFSMSRPKIDAVMMSGQPTQANLIVGNTGKEKITKFTFSSTDLEDSTTHRRADFGAAQPVTVELEPGREQTVALTLPRPDHAGTYIGTLNVIANDRVRKSIPMSVITRGPTFGKWNWLPFILFCVTLGIGYWLSMYLEQWFDLGGLERAQALLALEQANTDLVKTLKQVRAWEAANPGIQIDAARLRLDGDQRELKDLLDLQKRQSTDALKSNVARFTTLAAAGKILYLKVDSAARQWTTPATLKPVIDALDAVVFPTPAEGLDKYRSALDKVLADHINTKAPMPAGAPMPISEELSQRVSTEQLEIKIERMSWLKRIVVAIVVFITGYMMLYWKDADFGTLPDYFAVFLWALGLSTTGAGILTSAKSSYTRPA
jgi:hypothetical protein